MAPKLAISALLLLLVIIQALFGAQKGYTIEGLNQVKHYLKAFGYYSINGGSLTDSFDDVLESTLKSYQQHYRLKATGRIDSNTLKKMSTPRCGVQDIFNDSNDDRQLTYMFRSSAFVISDQQFRPIIIRAFNTWAVVSNFTFREANPSDIVMGFHRGFHGDNYPFDGPGNVLAHAFAPQNGKLHYDADENWNTNNVIRLNQIDLETIAIHEIGHILGLGHSQDPNTIMYAYYRPGTIKRNLGQDDIDGIRALYSN
ncbi:hypothetical protein E1A91_A11G077300v1 [Gossypium mustelinum]|uniref:Peptidase metallopeptidase domain-containing protein n=1 Tax=Gossypium mustelinum TaxID=34275 RepID=A0A5D2X6Q6_GOSMU|nr:hypothetical protein E1A91_A11G077300v1 [Gossypium mustelinum]